MFQLLLAIIYLAFISLGLPDALLGSAWPVMYEELQVPISYAGIISMIIAVGTVVSSLLSDRMTRSFGTGKVTSACLRRPPRCSDFPSAILSGCCAFGPFRTGLARAA